MLVNLCEDFRVQYGNLPAIKIIQYLQQVNLYSTATDFNITSESKDAN